MLKKLERKMTGKLDINIVNQPDETTCGPTSLQAVYEYYDDIISLTDLINEINQFEKGGGTLAVILGRHALARNYDVQIYCYNINIFDPTWFNFPSDKLIGKLNQRLTKPGIPNKKKVVIKEYISFLEEGGQLSFADLSKELWWDRT